ncbi:hypothetical protein, conserved [Eimeria maxima]|uniref:Uncharacterized protein n=1 Tax=Eimeria maxima TaxID=5804 RepID=U6MHM2_EIMMA|nr:hypothetical protein, conserved [Eimeria maxima]CDJ61135.1 hypothetical protein, conserved [Eimeria maxima]
MAAFRRAVPLLVAFVVVAFFSLGPTPHHFGCLQTQARASTGRAGKGPVRIMRKTASYPKPKTPTQPVRRSVPLQPLPKQQPPAVQTQPPAVYQGPRFSASGAPAAHPTQPARTPPVQAPAATATGPQLTAPPAHAQGSTQTSHPPTAAPWGAPQQQSSSSSSAFADAKGPQQPATNTPAAVGLPANATTQRGPNQSTAPTPSAGTGDRQQQAATPMTAAAGATQQPANLTHAAVGDPQKPTAAQQPVATQQQTGAAQQPPAGAFTAPTSSNPPFHAPASGYHQQPLAPAASPSYPFSGQQHAGYAYGQQAAHPPVGGQGFPPPSGVPATYMHAPGHTPAAASSAPPVAPSAAQASTGPSLTRTAITSAVGAAVGSMVGSAVTNSMMRHSAGSKEGAPATPAPAAGASDSSSNNNNSSSDASSSGSDTSSSGSDASSSGSDASSSGTPTASAAASGGATAQEQLLAPQDKQVSLPLFFLGVGNDELENSVKGPQAFGQQVQDAVVQALGVPSTRVMLEEVSVKKGLISSTGVANTSGRGNESGSSGSDGTSGSKQLSDVTVRLSVLPVPTVGSLEPTAGDLAAEVKRQLDQPASYLSRLLRSAFSELPAPVTEDSEAFLDAAAGGGRVRTAAAAAKTAENAAAPAGSPQGAAAGLPCLLLLLGSTVFLWI